MFLLHDHFQTIHQIQYIPCFYYMTIFRQYTNLVYFMFLVHDHIMTIHQIWYISCFYYMTIFRQYTKFSIFHVFYYMTIFRQYTIFGVFHVAKLHYAISGEISFLRRPELGVGVVCCKLCGVSWPLCRNCKRSGLLFP